MMRPFKPGDTLEDHAIPMPEVLQQLQVQLAEFKALKAQVNDSNADISVTHSIGDSFEAPSRESSTSSEATIGQADAS